MASKAKSKPGMLSVEIVGSQRLRNKMENIANKDIRRIDRNALNKGMTVIQKGIKSEITSSVGRGKDGRFLAGGKKDLKKSIGKRFKKNRKKGLMEAKVGAGVGKKKPKGKKDQWYLFLQLVGTTDRFTKKYKGKALQRRRYTGRIVKIPAVKAGFAKTESQAKEVMRASLEEGIEKAMGGK